MGTILPTLRGYLNTPAPPCMSTQPAGSNALTDDPPLRRPLLERIEAAAAGTRWEGSRTDPTSTGSAGSPRFAGRGSLFDAGQGCRKRLQAGAVADGCLQLTESLDARNRPHAVHEIEPYLPEPQLEAQLDSLEEALPNSIPSLLSVPSL